MKHTKSSKKSIKKSKKSGLLVGTKAEKDKYMEKLTKYNRCAKTHCSKELKIQKKCEKQNTKKADKLNCNLDETLNYKFDKYNQVKVTYDYNPLHFPLNKIKTSPCLKKQHKLLNDHSISTNKCINKHCKKEHKEYVGF